jgi:hypothetical protein
MAAEDVPPLLRKSVPPIFHRGEGGQPERAGTCALLTVFGCPMIAGLMIRMSATHRIIVATRMSEVVAFVGDLLNSGHLHKGSYWNNRRPDLNPPSIGLPTCR